MKLIMGVPTGSLVDEKRSDLVRLLEYARIKADNLSEDRPSKVRNIGWLEILRGRPQEFPKLAAEGKVDIFFCGDDWANEWMYRGIESTKLIGLDTGKVSIVVAGKPGYKPGSRLVVASEYTETARNYVGNTLNIAPEEIPIVEPGQNFTDGYRATVMESKGATEAKVQEGMADLIVESTQSGRKIRDYGLEIIETLLESECSLYAATGLFEWKMKKAQRIADMLQGVLNARGIDLVTFNVRKRDLDTVLRYIRESELFGDQETIAPNGGFTEVTIQVNTNDPEEPYIDIIGDLKELGATSIDGVPLLYSLK